MNTSIIIGALVLGFVIVCTFIYALHHYEYITIFKSKPAVAEGTEQQPAQQTPAQQTPAQQQENKEQQPEQQPENKEQQPAS